jgi:hypothetical protein
VAEAEETPEKGHTPGRGHRRKSDPSKKKRWRKKRVRTKADKDEAARRLWADWDSLTDEQRRLLGPKGAPKVPRPKDED